jgi:hypothetical protein
MGEISGLIARFGVTTVLLAALVFIIIHGRINFQYPRDDDRDGPGTKPPIRKLPVTRGKELSGGD